MKNLRTQLGFTQEQVANQTGMTRLAVLRYEQYLYEELSSKLVSFYAKQTDRDLSDIQSQYHQERLMVQYEANQIILEPYPSLRIIGGEHPFTTFRRTLTYRAVGEDSRMAFCKLLALHPSTVAEYEAAKLRSLPSAIRSALFSLPEDYLNNLNQLGEIYYDRQRRTT